MRTFVICLVAAVNLAPLSLRAETMDDEIDYLLETVAASDCTFIRNGKEHNSADASDHLATKRRRGKRYFNTTEEFIENLASKSSWSGRPYQIRCGDDEAVLAGVWFTALIDERRAALSSRAAD